MKGAKGRNKAVYNRYVCYRCFHKVNECTCKFYPPTSLIMIDEGMQDVVRIMNEKGYHTTGCCESHYKGVCQCIYICIADLHPSYTMPEGFRFQKSKRAIIHDYPLRITEEEFEAEKAKHLKILREWVETI